MAPDLLIRNGRVIDPKNNIDEITDIAVKNGKIAIVDHERANSSNIIDARDALVLPGIIDMHAHVYWGATSLGIDGDALAKRSGTTCWLDVGSAGPGNFAGFRRFIAERNQTKVRALLHISFAGIFGFGKEVSVGESDDLRLLNPSVCANIAKNNPDLIRGIKVRIGRHASGFNGIAPLDLALEAADLAGMPLMCHIDFPPPSIDDVLNKLRPGDVLTHAFRPRPNAPIDGKGAIREAVLAARERGVLFDIGHGMGSFSFDVAEQMLEQGFMPDVISSDVHALCIDGPAFDNLVTMTKFLHLGMPLPDVVRAVTAAPAAFMGEPNLGHLGAGATADIAILRQIDTPTRLVDVSGDARISSQRLDVQAVILDGQLWHDASVAN